MKWKKNLTWMLIVALFASIALTSLSRASPDILVYVDPENTNKRPGKTFDIYITASGVVDLFLAEFWLSFNASILAVVDDPATEEIEGVNTGDIEPYLEKVWVVRLNNTKGEVRVAVGREEGEKIGLKGTVQIAKVTFEVKAEGFCNLSLYDTRVVYGELYIVDPGQAPDQLHDTKDGFFTTELWDHDVAVNSVTVSSTTVSVGDSMTITVDVENQGKNTESFSVTVYYDNTTIGTQTVTDLASEASKNLTFTWDTGGVTLGTYTIKAEAEVVPGEVEDTSDNVRSMTVEVKEAASLDIGLYLIVGAVIALIAVVVAVRFRRRGKPKPT